MSWSVYRWEWNIEFDIPNLPIQSPSAVLTVSLAGYAGAMNNSIILNGATEIGKMTNGTLVNDGSLYRSATTAGE